MPVTDKFADARDKQHVQQHHSKYQELQPYCRAIAIVSRSSALIR
jgi:hypothetical protein